MKQPGTLTFFCGKMGAGKSTLAAQLVAQTGAVLLAEDDWLAALYPDQIKTLPDYRRCAQLLQPPIKQLVQSMLQAGIDVVLDFPANTRKQRTWLRSIFSEVKAAHRLLYLQASDELCLQQIARRREQQPERAATDTEAMFHQVNQYFQPPLEDEGFEIEVIQRH